MFQLAVIIEAYCIVKCEFLTELHRSDNALMLISVPLDLSQYSSAVISCLLRISHGSVLRHLTVAYKTWFCSSSHFFESLVTSPRVSIQICRESWPRYKWACSKLPRGEYATHVKMYLFWSYCVFLVMCGLISSPPIDII